MSESAGCPVVFIPADSHCLRDACDRPAGHDGYHHCPDCGAWYVLGSECGPEVAPPDYPYSEEADMTPERESERSGWYCPECAKETPHITCDGCKSLICYVCGYPCACGGDSPEMFGEAWMADAESGSASTGAWAESADEASATAQAEGLAAADLDEEAER
jgi:hypothetical protein